MPPDRQARQKPLHQPRLGHLRLLSKKWVHPILGYVPALPPAHQLQQTRSQSPARVDPRGRKRVASKESRPLWFPVPPLYCSILRHPRLQLDERARLRPPAARGAVEQHGLHRHEIRCNTTAQSDGHA